MEIKNVFTQPKHNRASFDWFDSTSTPPNRVVFGLFCFQDSLMAGYVRLYRTIQNNPLWLSEPFTRAQAWLDMVMLANYEEGHIRRNGLRILVKRGEIGWSYRALADRWKWSIGKVQRFMKELKNDAQIDTRFDTPNQASSTLICLVNYEKYQGSDTGPGTATDTATGTEERNKEVNNLCASKNDAPRKGFDLFWDAFAYKRGRTEAEKAWKKIKGYDGTMLEVILQAAREEAKRRPGIVSAGRTPKMAQGWITGRRWEDETEQTSEGNGDDRVERLRKRLAAA